MPEPEETRRALQVVTEAAVSTASGLLEPGAPDQTRQALLVATPEIVAYYSDGSAALAADHYDDLRDAAGAPGAYRAEPVVDIRDEKLRVGVIWATEPLYLPEPDSALAATRLAAVVQYETANPFRDTITTNTRRDPAAHGWRRVTSGTGCKFCLMLAGRGAVYRSDTAHFASHPHCSCTAVPAFTAGPAPTRLQLVASQTNRSASQQQALRDHLAALP